MSVANINHNVKLNSLFNESQQKQARTIISVPFKIRCHTLIKMMRNDVKEIQNRGKQINPSEEKIESL